MILKRNKSTIFGLNESLSTLTSGLATEETNRKAADGDLSTLTTTEKGSLVGALNELVTGLNTVTSSALDKSQNLADVDDAAAARTNLDVMSSAEINDAINLAQLALGTNYTVATIVERDALTDLDLQDNVFVADDGDGKWAQYKPAAIDAETGAVTDWTKVYDQDSLENSITAEGIKTAYESNPDTNAFTDADKAKSDFITVTKAVNLDQVVTTDALVTDIDANPAAAMAPSAEAVKNYTEAAVSQGGGIPVMESLVVSGDEITLTNTPRGAINGIMNFGTVRYVDENGVAWDAPVLPTADPKIFSISADSEGQWAGNTVQIQYIYSPSVA